ncbi:hypothetical protein EYB45_00650 [Erythrobacteraceae bacterium CFH 75059]|uniref:flagellin N-terminal helical domain-containing protein n=1 Tax=Qipengyuania thermophila TaxID=2509361 RepID=UPI001021FCDA|nr:hypothetical protein [Qipengyuania thermophila]TCD06284.1 hypothetical protein EYB45_00650 [Erythrobacteraceae bacterium CFH 75059]
MTAHVSTAGMFSRVIARMEGLRQSAIRLQDQVSTGQRLQRPSDDPAAAAGVRQGERADRLAEADGFALSRAAERIALADTALETIGEGLLRARELALAAASGAGGGDARQAVAAELMSLHDTLLAAVNTCDPAGVPLFSGSAGHRAFVLDEEGVARYAGDAAPPLLRFHNGRALAVGVTGQDIFNAGPAGDALALLGRVAGALRSDPATAQAVAATAVTSLDDALAAFAQVRARLGAMDAATGTLRDMHADEALARAELRDRLGGADLAESVARLQQTLAALEASRATFSRLSALSLFDHL